MGDRIDPMPVTPHADASGKRRDADPSEPADDCRQRELVKAIIRSIDEYFAERWCRDTAPPVRVENAFEELVPRMRSDRVAQLLRERPSAMHHRRAA